MQDISIILCLTFFTSPLHVFSRFGWFDTTQSVNRCQSLSHYYILLYIIIIIISVGFINNNVERWKCEPRSTSVFFFLSSFSLLFKCFASKQTCFDK